MFGKKKFLVATLFVVAVGSVLGALSTTIGLMIVARVLQGIGGATLPLAFGIIRDEAPREKIASSIAVVAAMLAVGGAAGIVLAGPIVDVAQLALPVLDPAVVVAVAAVAALIVVPESRSRIPGRIPYLPAILLSGWLIALLVALSEGEIWGWTSAKTLGLLAVAAVVAAAWAWVEVHATHPLIDMRMMRMKAVWTTNLVALLFGAAMYSAIGFLPEFLQTPPSAGYGFGASVTESGLFLLPMTVTMFAFGLISAPVAAASARAGAADRLAHHRRAVRHPRVRPHRPVGDHLASSVLGVGLGFAFASMSNLIVEAVDPTEVGVASGINANVRTIGGAIGGAIMATIVTSGAGADGLPTNSGYQDGFAFLMIAAILATLASAIIPARRRGGPSERELLADAHAIEHGETALVAGAALVDTES